ncbi:hypothetical protein KFE25_010579 [Diacronema lutheri]|uniref:TM2 domain-containing protein n=2 Tax=Diacronema lutheri TaxID=2081491 RepID=A0A8J6C452_DIALT|nr:hypothetical protein KFE25_010579 [Diacronema lutheri]
MSTSTNERGADVAEAAMIGLDELVGASPADDVRAYLGMPATDASQPQAHDALDSAESDALNGFLRDADAATLDGYLHDLLGPDPLSASASAAPSKAASESTSHGAPSAESNPPRAHAPPLAVARPVANGGASASASGMRKSPVVVVAPSRGVKRVELSRQIVGDQHLNAPAPRAPPTAGAAHKRALDAQVSPGSASGSGAGSSSALCCAGPPAAPAVPAVRERCELCGANKRGFGRGYCSNVACRERSTVVVRYEQRTEGGGKAAKLHTLDDSAVYANGAGDDADDDGAERKPRVLVTAYPAPAPAVGVGGGSGSSSCAQPQLAASWVEGTNRAPPPTDQPPAYETIQPHAQPAAHSHSLSPSNSSATARTDEARGAVEKQAECDLLSECYILALPLGFLGLHWFYLGRPKWGALYFFTFALLGGGWLVDLLRMPLLVRRARVGFGDGSPLLELSDMYTLAASPMGLLLGLHHWALGRYGWAVMHVCTVGFFGAGWLLDLLRLPCLVSEYNQKKSESLALVARVGPGSSSRRSGGAAAKPPGMLTGDVGLV